jgi:integrase/recombinase XerD
MRVQRVLMPGSRVESWTVLGDDHVPVEPVERFLAYLASNAHRTRSRPTHTI